MSVLEVRDLTYTYSPKTPFEKTALDNVSLSVENGELLIILESEDAKINFSKKF